MEKTISVRQLSLIAFISTFALRLTVLPSLLYENIKVDALIVIFSMIILDFVSFLLIFYVLKRNQNTSFYIFLSKRIGKILAKIILALIALFFLTKMLLLVRGGYNYIRVVIFKEAPLFMFIFVLMGLSSAMYFFKSKSYARTIEFFYPFTVVLFLVFLAIGIMTTRLYDIRPLFQSNFLDVADIFFKYLIAAGNYIFMLLFMGKIKFGSKKADNKTIYGHIFLGILTLLAFYLLFYSIFRYTAFIHVNAISELVQFLPLPTILGNLDWVAITLMMMLFLLQGGLFMFCICDPIYEIVKTKRFNKKNCKIWIVLSVNILIIILLFLVFENFLHMVVFFYTYFSYLWVIICLIPLTVFLIEIFTKSKKKRKLKYEKDY